VSRKQKISITFPPVKYGYDITLGNGFLEVIAGDIKRNFPNKKLAILSDNNVSAIYASKLKSAFDERELHSIIISFPAGEKSKSSATKELIESKMIKNGFDRSTILLALGGGVTGDLGGYIAATFMRGIPFIQIPTSLLAMVDSSIGGKVAINHPMGKNLIGAFYQPRAVYIDVSMLKTLPVREYYNGLAEIIKTALIEDKRLFESIIKNKILISDRSDRFLLKLIMESCRIKGRIVMEDEKESGKRKLLNYGHTIGHAIEILTGFSIPHGFCVSIGMNVENIIAYKMGILGFDDYLKINEILRYFNLPVKIPSKINLNEILKKVRIDKKSINSVPFFTLIRGIGLGSIDNAVEEDLILEALGESR